MKRNASTFEKLMVQKLHLKTAHVNSGFFTSRFRPWEPPYQSSSTQVWDFWLFGVGVGV
jgi:hypothetical protein